MLLQIYIYTEHPVDPGMLKQTIAKQFGLTVTADITPVPLSNARLLSPDAWPRFTLLGQSLGAAIVAFAAAQELVPEVLIPPVAYRRPRGRASPEGSGLQASMLPPAPFAS